MPGQVNSASVSTNAASEPSSADTGAAPAKYYEADAGDGTTAQEQYLHGIPLLLSVTACVLCLFLTALDTTIVSTMLTVVGNEFQSFNEIGWLTSGFLLPMAVLAATWGKLSITFGRKWTMVVCVVLFEIGSLVSALANSMDMLIGGRVISGVGGGGIQTLVFVIISETVPINKRPTAFASIGCTFAVASVLGPLVGGVFTTKVTWRWCFWINLPIGGVALLFLLVAYRPPLPKGSIVAKLKTIDYLGIFLMAAALVQVLLALTFGGVEYPWRSAAVVCLFVIGGMVGVVFCVYNFKYSRNPLIPPDVVRALRVDAATVAMAMMFAAFISCVLYLSIYFQVVRGADSWQSGIDLLPLIVTLIITSLAGSVVIRVLRYVKPFALAAAVLGPVGCGLLSLLTVDSSISHRIGLCIVLGVGVGLMMQTGVILAQLAAPKSPGGLIMSTTFVNFGRALGGTIGVDLAQTVFQATLKTKFILLIASNAAFRATVEEVLGPAADANVFVRQPDLVNLLPKAASRIAKQAVMESIHNVFYLTIGFFLCTSIAVVFTCGDRLPKESDMEKIDDAKLRQGLSDDGKPLGGVTDEATKLSSETDTKGGHSGESRA